MSQRIKLGKLWDIYGTLCILLVIVVLFSALSPTYFTRPENIVQIFLQSSITIMIALGEFFPILIAGIDLSVGSVLALTGMMTAQLMVAGFNPVLAVGLGGVGGGLVLGAINGLLVNFTGLHPFIITLGTNAIFRGVTMIISGASPVFGFSYSFVDTVTGFVGFVPVPVIFALSFAVVLWFFTAKTRLGRNIYAVGGNKAAAALSGVSVPKVYFVVMMNMSFLAALAGILFVGRATSAGPSDGTMWELDAIASVFIGGAAVSGGIGTVVGSMIGGLVMAVLNSGLMLMGVGADQTQVIKGLVLLAAVAIDVANKRQGGSSIFKRKPAAAKPAVAATK